MGRKRRAGKTRARPEIPRIQVAIGAAAITILTGLLFAGAAKLPFVNLDDPAYVLEQPFIARGFSLAGVKWSLTHFHGGNWHPLTSISHMLDCQFFGLNPVGHHVVNVLFHAATAGLLVLALEGLTGAFWRSTLVAAFFAWHPLRVESVAWVAERKDVLSAFFFVLTLYSYHNYVRRKSWRSYSIVLVLFALGLMCKPMLVTTPLILILLDYWPLRRWQAERWQKLLTEKIPLCVLCLLSSMATMLAQKSAISAIEQVPAVVRFANALDSYGFYLSRIFWPSRLSFFYPFPAHIGVASLVAVGVGLVGLTAACWVLRRTFPFILTGWLWFVVMLLPVIGIIQVGRQSHADRYTYLPQIGILIAVVWGVSKVTEGNRTAKVSALCAGGVMLSASAALTVRQLGYWKDSETLWRHAIDVIPENAFAHSTLSDYLLREGRVDDSFREAMEAVRLRPDDGESQNDLALAYFRMGKARDAAEHWRIAYDLRPDDLNVEVNYAWLLSTAIDPSLRDGPRAVQLVSDVLSRDGTNNPWILRAGGAALAEAGRFPEAIQMAEQARQIASAQQDKTLQQDLEMNLANYQRGRALRDPGVTPSP